MKRRRKRMNTIRQPMVVSRVRRSNAWPAVKLAVLIAVVSVGVLMMILFGFPLIEDLIKGVDPGLRYQPKIETDFSAQKRESKTDEMEPAEMYLADWKVKNDPYIAGDHIIFTTQQEKKDVFQLDAVGIYNTKTSEVQMLENVEKKYDNLMSPMLSGNMAVWIDSMTNGGGRIVGYDLSTNKQFLIKEYGYAIPQLSVAGDTLAFMQWAGDTTQRLYVYNLKTREAVTVKLYETEAGNSAVDISDKDMVWSEYDEKGGGALKRIAFADGDSKYENYDVGMNVYEPKTNGRDIVFATEKDIISGALMLSTNGGIPVKVADNVLNYDVGDGFVTYTKDEKVCISLTNAQDVVTLTADISKNLLSCVNGTGITYYDITDGVLTDEVVMYAYVN